MDWGDSSPREPLLTRVAFMPGGSQVAAIAIDPSSSMSQSHPSTSLNPVPSSTPMPFTETPRAPAQVADNDDGVIVDYNVELGAVPDGPQLAPAIERVSQRAGRIPAAVTADRGYGQSAVERDLQELGVRTVAIPRQATTSPARKPSSTAAPSACSSNGGPAAKGGSATSYAATAGIASVSTARPEPPSGAAPASSLTT